MGIKPEPLWGSVAPDVRRIREELYLFGTKNAEILNH
jgi:hypothetical protein